MRAHLGPWRSERWFRREIFWRLINQAVNYTYANLEPFYLFRYLDGQAFRYNNRSANDADRLETANSQIVGQRITY
jgi:hypothetical protein